MTRRYQHSGHTQPDRAVSGIDRSPARVAVVVLACTACQLVYEPNLAAFDTGNTGCPRCGGWTWIAYLGASPSGKETLR